VNTPPPSSTTPPPSTTSNTTGSGVGAPDGYTTDTGQMSSAGRNISTKAEDAKGDVDEVKPAKVQVAEFGTKHQEWHPDYSAAIEAFGTAATAMCDNLMAFAGQLGDAGTSYDASETGATTTVTQAGP
jgi:hypothetical protein